MNWMLFAAAVLMTVAAAIGGVWYGRHGTGAPGAARSRIGWGSVVCLTLAVALLFIGLLWRPSDADSAAGAMPLANSGPVVPVKTGTIRLSTIEETITVYGTVVAQLGETQMISVPYESRVGRLFVSTGEQVSADTPLLAIEPSAASRAQLKEAQDVAATAEKELQQEQEQYDQRLATNSQLLRAKQSYQTARHSLETLKEQGVGQNATLRAQAAGIIQKVSVQQGQIVPAGAPLVQNALANRIEVKLGIEPEDVPYIHDNALVQLFSINGDNAPIVGHVRLITQQVNPTTRLVDVFVALPATRSLMLEAYVRGKIVTASKKTLVVPREAVLPAQEGDALYTVEHDRAVKHVVHVGLESPTEVEIDGKGIREGMAIVLTGNYELTSGMAVSIEKTP